MDGSRHHHQPHQPHGALLHGASARPEGQAYSQRWWTLGVLVLSLLIVMIDHSVVIVALPKIIRSTHATASAQQWIVDAYIVVFAGLLLTVGIASDRWGRKRFLMTGLVIFAAASIGAALAKTPAELIAARAVAGLGASFIMPPTLSILTAVFTNRSEFNRAIGVWAATAGVGGAIGPSLGGWLTGQFGWQSVFWINIPVASVAIVLGIFLVPGSRSSHPRRVDPVGTVLSGSGLGLLLWAIIGAPERNWLSTGTLTGIIGGAALLAGFAIWEGHHRDPMLDLRIFRGPRVTPAIATIGTGFIVLGSALYFITQYLQFVLGYSPLRAGLGILPVAVSVAVSAPVGMSLGQRFGIRQITMAGLAMLAAGLTVLAAWTAQGSYLATGIGLLLAGIGLGLGTASATAVIMTGFPPSSAGTASAMNNLTHEVSSALGIGIFGSLLATGYRSRISPLLGRLDLPASGSAAAGDSVGGAMNVAGQLHGAHAADLTSTARDAFLNSMHTSLIVAIGLIFLGLLAASMLPGRDAQVTLPDEPERAHSGLHDFAALHGHGTSNHGTSNAGHSGVTQQRPQRLLHDLAALHGHSAPPEAETSHDGTSNAGHSGVTQQRPQRFFHDLAALHGHSAPPEAETSHAGADPASRNSHGTSPGSEHLAALHILAAFHASGRQVPQHSNGDSDSHEEHTPSGKEEE